MARKKQRPRRKPNTGAIRFKKGRTQPYEAAFPLGHSEYRYDSFATWEDATAHLDKLTAERDDVTSPRNIVGGAQRLDRFLTDWLTIKRPHIKAKTYQDYEYQCNLGVGYFGGDRRIDSIGRKDADVMYAYFHKRGYKNVAQLRMVLGQAFEYAEEEDYTKGNAFKRAKAPPVERPKRTVLTKTQRAYMLECAFGTELEIIWHPYSRLGFRRGEGIGLLWSNINWDEKTITISQQYTTVYSKTVKETPKTKRSSRTFPVPNDIIAMLRRLQTEQLVRVDANPNWEWTDLVFTDGHGHRLAADHVYWHWGQLKKRAHIPEQVTIHDLRHTALYHMEQAGIPESARMAFAGHSSATMARKYADHATEDMDALRAALKRLEP